jgi:hypothetical protein
MRSLRLSTVALVTVATMAIAGSIAADASARDSSGCMRTREGQRLLVGLSFHYKYISTYFTMQTGSSKVLDEYDQAFAALRIGGTTCEVRPGVWRALEPIRAGVASLGLSPDGQPRGNDRVKGWGAGISFAAPGMVPRVDLQVMYCSKGAFFRNLKFLESIPIPWTKPIFSVLQWGVGLFLPGVDKVKCQDMGTTSLRMRGDKEGALRVVAVRNAEGTSEYTPATTGSGSEASTTKYWDVLPPKQTPLPASR